MQLEEQESGELNVLNKVLRVNAGRDSGMFTQAGSLLPVLRRGSIPCMSIVAKSLKAAGGI